MDGGGLGGGGCGGLHLCVVFLWHVVCVSMLCVSEISFFLDLTGIVCLLRFDGTEAVSSSSWARF
jgi:hypothetical protein